MTPTLVGVVLLVIGLYDFVARPNLLMPTLVFVASFSGTSVLNFSNFGVSPGVLFLGLFLFRKALSHDITRPLTVGRSHPALVLCIGAFGVFVLAGLLFNGATQTIESFQLTQLIYLVVGVVMVATVSFEMCRKGQLDAAVNGLRAGACFIGGWGIVQALCFYGGIAYPAFLFNNSASHFANMFDQVQAGIIRIASVAAEPSFMASSLMIFGTFGATVVVCEPRLRTPGWTLPTAFVLVMVVASTSTSGFFCLAVLGLLLALRRPGVVMLTGLGSVLIFAVALVLLPRFRDAIYLFTFGKTSTSSFVDRTATLGEAIATFADRPLIGAGWGSDLSYSIVTSMPANVGLIGSLLFIAALGGTLLTSFSVRRTMRNSGQWRLLVYAMAAENAMLVYMAQAVVGGFKYVVPDFWCLWAFCLAIPSNLATAALRAPAAGAVPVAAPRDPGGTDGKGIQGTRTAAPSNLPARKSANASLARSSL